ncbi:MAG: HTH-type transcriptional repressor FabR [Pseudomonadales bacterium]|nr:HTH-type transcriptional repressor FabR [Pseudomonadales bacterium]
MTIRAEKKAKTRRSLLDAALTLMESGRSFTGLSLREVTKEAGVVPTSFYRHFEGMEELGLVIVDELGLEMRPMMRDVRQRAGKSAQAVTQTAHVYIDTVMGSKPLFRFLIREIDGSSAPIREAIRNELRFFGSEMARDYRELFGPTEIDVNDVDLVAEMVITLMAHVTSELLDMSDKDSVNKTALVNKLVRQQEIIFLGLFATKSQTFGAKLADTVSHEEVDS